MKLSSSRRLVLVALSASAGTTSPVATDAVSYYTNPSILPASSTAVSKAYQITTTNLTKALVPSTVAICSSSASTTSTFDADELDLPVADARAIPDAAAITGGDGTGHQDTSPAQDGTTESTNTDCQAPNRAVAAFVIFYLAECVALALLAWLYRRRCENAVAELNGVHKCGRRRPPPHHHHGDGSRPHGGTGSRNAITATEETDSALEKHVKDGLLLGGVAVVPVVGLLAVYLHVRKSWGMQRMVDEELGKRLGLLYAATGLSPDVGFPSPFTPTASSSSCDDDDDGDDEVSSDDDRSTLQESSRRDRQRHQEPDLPASSSTTPTSETGPAGRGGHFGDLRTPGAFVSSHDVPDSDPKQGNRHESGQAGGLWQYAPGLVSQGLSFLTRAARSGEPVQQATQQAPQQPTRSQDQRSRQSKRARPAMGQAEQQVRFASQESHPGHQGSELSEQDSEPWEAIVAGLGHYSAGSDFAAYSGQDPGTSAAEGPYLTTPRRTRRPRTQLGSSSMPHLDVSHDFSEGEAEEEYDEGDLQHRRPRGQPRGGRNLTTTRTVGGKKRSRSRY
ncbi:hypothetical protein Micbo1qcDRAFT_204503 [Microdochium bolleyi]|uniref:Uncharacterized protein n=1 Tax=Microdochium bolleyi TaxID=196109 RepID=A0A136J247_9PEZI|nr:hypothetical protein Micbo1qcDRAFT_204503 [Microdochium bolleyi]